MLTLNADNNSLIVGTDTERRSQSLSASNINFTSGTYPTSPIDVEVKIRYSAKETAAKLVPADKGLFNLKFKNPVLDVTPGQSAVFYQKDCLVGGGIILP